MIGRFRGKCGEQNVVTALLSQSVVAGDRALAERLAVVGEVLEFKVGEVLIEQDGGDDAVFCIINGTVDVLVNGQRVAAREGGMVVGEMAAINPSARRSATLRAASTVVALKISAREFNSAGAESASFWRCLALLTGERLRERAKFHFPPNETPVMFVGSSAEGLPVAREIAAALKHDDVIVRVWTTRGVFGPSGVPVDDLLRQANKADFAVLVFGPDDTVLSREQETAAPRDNVIFEIGLFMGRLGRERVYMVREADVDLKIPSDLLGINPITYKRKPGCSCGDMVESVCSELRKAIASKGVLMSRSQIDN